MGADDLYPNDDQYAAIESGPPSPPSVTGEFYGPLSSTNRWRRMPRCRAKGCQKEAAWAKMRITCAAAIPESQSVWCDDHIAGLVERRKLPWVIDPEEVQIMVAQARRVLKRHNEEHQKRLHQERAQTMARDGRVLCASGHKGRVYEMPSGRFVVWAPRGSEPIAACCLGMAWHVADVRYKGQPIPLKHSPDCRAYPASSC